MAEKQIKNMLQDMPVRQKVMIGITAVIVLIVIWQITTLFGGHASAPPAPKSVAVTNPMTANAPQAMKNTLPKPGMAPAIAPAATPVPPSQVPQQAVIPADQTVQEQQKTEQRYLQQLNDLEQLKLQRQIEETNQAIAAAKLATVTAEKSINDLLKPVQPVIPEGAYANQLANPTRSGTAVVSPPPGVTPPVSQTPPSPPPIPEVGYTVISVSMQFNKWSAVVGAEGKLFNVAVGDTLPLDGSVVTLINKGGITLKKDGKTRKIAIVSSI